MREIPPADAFPVDALGGILGSAAHAIHDRVQAPLAICGQSVLAAASLAAQGHADVVLPIGQGQGKSP
jgi:putative DNA primase/helicase